MIAEALTLRFGLLLAEKGGCNRLVIISNNMEVTDTMKTGGHFVGAEVTVFDDFFWLVIFLLLVLNIIIGKQIRLLTNLLGYKIFYDKGLV